VQVWWRSGHLSARRSDLRKSLQTDRRTDRRRTPRHCISSLAKNDNGSPEIREINPVSTKSSDGRGIGVEVGLVVAAITESSAAASAAAGAV